MKKITLIIAAAFMFACSDDDGGSTGNQDSYSAHMKSTCPESSPTYDVCVSESVWWYLDEQRNAAGVNNCLLIEFEDIDGNLVEDYLIRVEKNVIDCNQD